MPQKDTEKNVEVIASMVCQIALLGGHINCQDMKRDNRSGDTNSQRPFIGTNSNIIGVGRDWRDLIPTYHCQHHLPDIVNEATPNGKNDLAIRQRRIDIVEVVTGRRDLILAHHHRHLADVVKEAKHNGNKDILDITN